MKIGRNDPCPCGSGKKYKKCCLHKEEASTVSRSLYYRRLSETCEKVMDELIDYAVEVFGQEAMGVAMDEFLAIPGNEVEITQEMLERFQVPFWPWFVFNWFYDPDEAMVELSGPQGVTVAELYLKNMGKRLNSLEKLFINSANRTLYSFWQAVEVNQGRSIKLQDVLRGTVVDVVEYTASNYMEKGDIIFARIVTVDTVGMLVGVGTTLIPPAFKPEVINLRKAMTAGRGSASDDALFDWDMEIRELYFWIDNHLHTPASMVNTDGHRLEFHRLVYEINSSAQDVFEKLCSLSVVMTPEEILADAKRDEEGRLVRVEFSWDRLGHKANKALPNTVLGRIVIDGRRLTAEVNSAERARTLRKKIKSRLGKHVSFKVDEIQDFDTSKLSEPGDSPAGSLDSQEMLQIPEVREKLREMVACHWEDWVDMKIPALGGRSPRQAVRSADGREAVEALLMDAERDRGDDPLMMEANRLGIQRARKLLGLKAVDD